ncbi:MAG: permease-like cell division protein FtsX [Candidatus Margulisbacteria bacterium]|nr:permease-like cell division protein FtsX [Candidatus Margulisiibacteriota bacterium]
MNLRIIKFFFEESFISLRQNMLMAVISIMTIMVSLVMLASFILLFINLNTLFGGISNNLSVTIYLNKDITSSGISKVQEQITSIAGIKNYEFVSKESAWNKLKSKFQYQDDIVSLVLNNPLPDSFVLRLNSTEQIERIVRELRFIDGVQEVRYGREVVSKLRKIVQIFNYVGLSLVGFLLIVTLLITINTINLTILAKRNEVQIMKLVGATNSFIKWSFIIEGLIIGLLGSLAAVVAVDAIYSYISIKVQNAFPFMSVFLKNFNLVTLDIFLICLGLFIGIIGSFLSIKKLLKAILRRST